MKLFWKLNEVKIEETYKTKMLKSYKLDLLPLKVFYLISLFGQVLYFYNITHNIDSHFLKFLPMKLRFKYYVFVFRFFALVLQFWTCLLVLAFNTVLVYSCLILTAQFQMLGQRLKIIINEEDYKKSELIVCIKYHNFLIRYLFSKDLC